MAVTSQDHQDCGNPSRETEHPCLSLPPSCDLCMSPDITAWESKLKGKIIHTVFLWYVVRIPWAAIYVNIFAMIFNVVSNTSQGKSKNGLLLHKRLEIPAWGKMGKKPTLEHIKVRFFSGETCLGGYICVYSDFLKLFWLRCWWLENPTSMVSASGEDPVAILTWWVVSHGEDTRKARKWKSGETPGLLFYNIPLSLACL